MRFPRLLFLISLISFFLLLASVRNLGSFPTVENRVLVKQIEVPAAMGWVDTGLEVKEGDKFEFLASGTISCQKGNPIANCGPEGLDLQTPQQPIPEKNLGALVGKVVKVLSVTKDEKTGEEIREEVFKVFYIGTEAEAEMPLEGQLYLGINDNVYADNDGKFMVSIFKKQG